jgi:hypothetical protein
MRICVGSSGGTFTLDFQASNFGFELSALIKKFLALLLPSNDVFFCYGALLWAAGDVLVSVDEELGSGSRGNSRSGD